MPEDFSGVSQFVSIPKFCCNFYGVYSVENSENASNSLMNFIENCSTKSHYPGLE